MIKPITFLFILLIISGGGSAYFGIISMQLNDTIDIQDEIMKEQIDRIVILEILVVEKQDRIDQLENELKLVDDGIAKWDEYDE